MTASSLTAFLSVLLLLPSGSIAATLHQDVTDGAKLVRRETTQQLELTPHAEVHQALPHVLVKTQTKRAVQDVEDEDEDQSLAYCDYDYILGKENTNDCLDSSLQDPLDETMCLLAGNESGARTDHALFKILEANENDHPKGCFKTNCGRYVANPPASDVCYFWNDVEQPKPTGVNGNGPVGTPICSRRRWWDGANDSAADDGGCPTGYMVVHSEAVCREAGRCRSQSADPQFLIGTKNASQHQDHPKGCFFDHVLKEVFYNDPNFFTAGVTPPSSVKGTPICIVSQVLHWGASSTNSSGR